VDPRAGVAVCGKSRPHRDSIPESSSTQQVAIASGLSRVAKWRWLTKLQFFIITIQSERLAYFISSGKGVMKELKCKSIKVTL
jgi:hypothetical protein